MSATHEVFNQVEPLVNVNLFAGNRAMRDALRFNAPKLDTAHLQALGQQVGSAEMQTNARLANVFTPQLKTHSRSGYRIDQVEFHPSYHALMSAATAAGCPAGEVEDESVVAGLAAPKVEAVAVNRVSVLRCK